MVVELAASGSHEEENNHVDEEEEGEGMEEEEGVEEGVKGVSESQSSKSSLVCGEVPGPVWPSKERVVKVEVDPLYLQQVEVGGRLLVPGGELGEQEDSLVTRSFLHLTAPTETRSRIVEDRRLKEGSEENSREDMEEVIQQLGRALTQSRGMSSVSRALARGNVRGRRGSEMREGEQGRGKRGEEHGRGKKGEYCDNSLRSYNVLQTQRNIKKRRKAAGGNWRLESSPSKQYSNLSSTSKQYSKFSPPSQQHSNIGSSSQHQDLYSKTRWHYNNRAPKTPLYSNVSHYPFLNARKPLPRLEVQGSSLTLGEWAKEELGRKERKRRHGVLFCKSTCFILLVASFILVIVAVSVFLSKGKNHFGPI